MGNSSLIDCTKLSPNHSGLRTHEVDTITPHCFVGQVTVEKGLDVFTPQSREASCNYVIGTDGKVGLCVNENCRSWCTSSNDNDQRAITIECASDSTQPYAFNDAVYSKLVELCTDICKRYGKTKLIWIEDKDVALSYSPKTFEMIITVHRWFANKSCPGEWLYRRLGELADTVTKNLETVLPTKSTYAVQTGAFLLKANAENQKQKLEKKGFNSFITKEGLLYKVQLGAFENKNNADNYCKNLNGVGIKCFVTKKE